MNDVDITLKEYLEKLLMEYEKHVNVKFENIKEATKLALDSTDKRLSELNNFRETVSDHSKRFADKAIVDTQVEQLHKEYNDLRERVNSVQSCQANLEGRLAAYGIALSIGITIVSVLIKFI